MEQTYGSVYWEVTDPDRSRCHSKLQIIITLLIDTDSYINQSSIYYATEKNYMAIDFVMILQPMATGCLNGNQLGIRVTHCLYKDLNPTQ